MREHMPVMVAAILCIIGAASALLAPRTARRDGPDRATIAIHTQILTRLRRSALVTTLTDDKAIAAAAIMGDRRMPNTG
jgi:hypothetical protein